MPSSIVITSAEDVLITTTKVSRQHLPSFQAYGSFNGTTRHGIETIDFIDILLNANAHEKFVIKHFKDNLEWDHKDNELKITSSEFTSGELTYWRKGVKTLKEKNLIASTRRGYYMMNPGARVPKDYKASKELWDKSV